MQHILLANAGLNFEGFVSYLATIVRRRLAMLQGASARPLAPAAVAHGAAAAAHDGGAASRAQPEQSHCRPTPLRDVERLACLFDLQRVGCVLTSMVQAVQRVASQHGGRAVAHCTDLRRRWWSHPQGGATAEPPPGAGPVSAAPATRLPAYAVAAQELLADVEGELKWHGVEVLPLVPE